MEEYDQQVLMALLVVASKYLNLGNVENLHLLASIANDSLGGVSFSIEDFCLFLVKPELFLYRCLLMSENDVYSFLQWWKDHAKQFPNVSFRACQFLGIPSSQIETEWIFNIVGILTSLRWC